MGILSAIAGPLIGGLFRKKEKTPPPPKWKPINYKKLRKAAEKGGFNPLTTLMAGGGQSGAWASEPAALSSNSFIGEALASGVRAWAEYDPLQQEKSRLENDLMRAELDRMNKEANNPVQGFASGVMVANNPTHTTTSSKLSYGGMGWDTAPDTSDADAIEQRYGDVGSALYGLAVGVRDVAYNLPDWVGRTLVGPKLSSDQWTKFYNENKPKPLKRDPSAGVVPDYFAP